MTPEKSVLDADIFTVSNLLSTNECTALIDQSESRGFAAATVRTRSGQKLLPKVRNNDRVNFEDTDLCDVMWERVLPFLSDFDESTPIGVDGRLRVYRYLPGQEFKRHRDGKVTDQNSNVSMLSYLIYLNDGYQGGTTLFRDYSRENGQQTKTEIAIEAHTGMALLFRHRRWHESTPLVSGVKYVLRTDVFFSQPN